MQSPNNWQIQRRTKVALANNGSSDRGVATRQSRTTTNSAHTTIDEDDGRSDDDDEVKDEVVMNDEVKEDDKVKEDEEDEYSDEDDELPGAYAVTRQQQQREAVEQSSSPHNNAVTLVEEEDWDPTATETMTAAPAPEIEVHDDVHHIEEDILQAHVDVDEYRDANQQKLDRLCGMTSWLAVILMMVGLVAGLGALVGVLMATNNESETTTSDPNTITNEAGDDNTSSRIRMTDPFLQCERVGRIDEISEEVQDTYDSLLFRDDIVNLLSSGNNSDSYSDRHIHSCDVENIALVWIADEINAWEAEGDDLTLEEIPPLFTLCVIYAALGAGSGWTTQTHGITDRFVCDWIGVSCDVEGKVTSLALPDNNLQGTLDTRLGLLYDLKKLDLTDNAIEGTIPLELWSLPDLEELLLGNNKLDGTLPTNLEGPSTTLQRLRLSDNEKLTGSLSSFSGFPNLKEISFSGTHLDGSLSAFDFSGLVKLEILELSQMDGLTGFIPSTINLLTSLRKLVLDQAPLSGTIPESIGDLSSLEHLILHDTNISGTLPRSLERLTNLVVIDVSHNLGLSGSIPSELASCPRLESIDLSQTSFTGTLPSELGAIQGLQIIRLQCLDRVNGTVPVQYANLESLTELDISGSGIEGTIPSGLCTTGAITSVVVDGARRCFCCRISCETCISRS
mmetsp:Transcript_29022/g.47930  ORF Transcript_29022/g.47930 Transcript_29022/m.47930 type:complete len:678 (-) Transcript_29022:2695-4728(-)